MDGGTRTGCSGEPLAPLRARTAGMRRVGCRIENVFGTREQSHGLHCLRWLGSAEAGLPVRLAAMACDPRRTLTLLRASRHVVQDGSARGNLSAAMKGGTAHVSTPGGRSCAMRSEPI